MTYSRELLGELLINADVIDEEQLEEALDIQGDQGGKIGEILVARFGISEESIAAGLAGQKGLEHVRLSIYPIDHEATSQIPVRLARHQRVIPIAFQDGSLVLAMADPLNIEAVDEVRMTSGRDVIPVVTTETEISHAIDKFMTSAEVYHDVEISLVDEEEGLLEDADLQEDAPIIRLVNQLIRDAVTDRASDIHIEPDEAGIRVRYRVDGVLQEIMQLPQNVRAGVTSRVKIMADLDIAERRLPQDGRSVVYVDDAEIDLRVATLPTPYGEMITIRILQGALAFRSLEGIALSDEHLETMRFLLSRPYGAVLAAGPTGSGKTTTLYAALNHINQPGRKIITIEDPIEYRMDGITQMAVNPKIGLTFANGLRTILRADPDVVMIGEMRDPETAEIGVRAALTGHLVLSSIHTNDAPAALARLVDMGVPPYITSSALLGVVAQRLARRLCPDCRVERPPTQEELNCAGVTPEEANTIAVVYDAPGCDACSDTGYHGRVGLFEMMVMSDELRCLFIQAAPTEEVRNTALRQGMISMRQDAIEKVARGITSLKEITRVVV